jgi:hypothetical protein
MSEAPLTVSWSETVSERFTGQVRWLAEAGTSTRPLKLQQCIEVTKYGRYGHATERNFEWRDVPFETERSEVHHETGEKP